MKGREMEVIVKDDMTRDNYSLGDEIKATKATMIRGGIEVYT